MAIDWSRVARGVGTGYLSAKIANTEANDKLNADIIKAAGLRFHEKTYPEWEAKEKLYKKDYKMVEAIHGKKVANYFADKDLFGTGNGLNDVESILKKYNINKADLNKLDLSTFEERKTSRLEEIQSKERQIMELTTGSSKIGPMTVKNQLEGFGKDETTITDTGTGVATTEAPPANIPGTPIVPIQERSTMEQEPISGTLFTPKAPDVEGAQARYKHIANTVNELEGYTKNVIYGEGGQVNLNMFGERRAEAGAHIALADRLIRLQPEKYNQNNATSTAKQQLNFLTMSPFTDIASDLGVKYDSGSGKIPALLGTVGDNYDVNHVLKNGRTIDQSILERIAEIPVGPSGEINQLVLERLIENIPDQLTINGESYKQQLQTELAIRTSQFWSKRTI